MPSTTEPGPGLSLLVVGLVAALLGVVALTWPGATLLTIAVLFGTHLIVVGALRVLVALRTRALPRFLRWFVGALGALVLAAGILTLVNPFGGLEVLAYLIGIGWIVDGIAGLFGGMPDAAIVPRGLAVATCIVSIVGGLVVLVLPGASIAAFLGIGAAVLIALGILLVLAWMLMRRRR